MSIEKEEAAESTLTSALSSAISLIDPIYSADSESKTIGLKTGFDDLDSMTSGLLPGDLIVIASRPSMGKTALSINIAENVTRNSTESVAFFSMEMNEPQLAMRILCSRGIINLHELRTGQMGDDDWERLVSALQALNTTPIDIIEPRTVGWSANCLEQTLLTREAKPSLVIIDGLHSLDVTNTETAYDRNIQLGEQVRQLKKMALKLSIPVILTAPLTREPENRPNKRPVLKDLRDVGMLEDIADLILFIYRDEFYNMDSPNRGVAEIIIGKQRNGPVGTVKLTFQAESMRFENFCNPDY